MPKVGTPISLRNTTLIYIVKHLVKILSSLWHVTNSAELTAILNGITEFVYSIPNTFANEFVRIMLLELNAAHQMTHVRAVLHPACTEIEIGAQRGREIHQIDDDFTTLICKNVDVMPKLTNLTLPMISVYLDTAVVMLTQNIINFGVCNLVTINLPELCDAALLNAFANHCPLLEHLNAEYSTIEKRNLRCLVRCRKLRYLSIDSRLTCGDMQEDIAYLIHHMPTLQNVNWCDIGTVIPVLRKEYATVDTTYNLDYAFFHDIGDNIGELCKLFPKLKTVHITKPLKANLGQLSLLKKLQSVILYEEVDVGGLEHFFSVTSSQLTDLSFMGLNMSNAVFSNYKFQNVLELSLYGAKQLDIVIVDQGCPCITSMFLRNCEAKPLDSAALKRKGFRTLEILRLHGCFSENHLLYILSSCTNMQLLSIGTIKWPIDEHFFLINEVTTDDFWKRLAIINPMPELKELSITSDALTVGIFEHLFNNFEKLEFVDLHGNHWKEHIQKIPRHYLYTFQKYYLTILINQRELYSPIHSSSRRPIMIRFDPVDPVPYEVIIE